MLQTLQIEPLLTLDGVVERPLTNFHDFQEGAQGRVRVAVLPKQLCGAGNRLLVIERDAARHSTIVARIVAVAKTVLTRGSADRSICSVCYRPETVFMWACWMARSRSCGARRDASGRASRGDLAPLGRKWRDSTLSKSKNAKAGQRDDRSALYEHRTPCMEAHHRAARPDVLVDER